MNLKKLKLVSFECPHSLLKLIQQYREGNPGYSLSQAIRSLIALGLTVKSYTPETVKKAQGIK